MAGTGLPLLRRFGRVVRSARPEDRARLRAHPAARRRPLRHARRARKIDRRMRAPRRQRDAVPAARDGARGHAERARRQAHRHLRSARVQLAAQRISRSSAVSTRSSTTRNSSRDCSPTGASASTRRYERVIYHEPCYLGRHNGEYEAPRAILARLTRDAPLEFALRREKAMCCGAGGGAHVDGGEDRPRINIARVEQALSRRRNDRDRLPLLRGDDGRWPGRAGAQPARPSRATSPSSSPMPWRWPLPPRRHRSAPPRPRPDLPREATQGAATRRSAG